MREMKNSGIGWIGEIPAEWKIVKVKQAFFRKNEKAQQENPVVLSLARSGVKVRDITANEGQIAESYYNYNPVSIGDLLLNPMDLYSGANCSISKVEGVISPAYANLRSKEGYFSNFYDYYFKVHYWMMVLFAHGKGVSFDNRWTLTNETLMNFPVVAPSLDEQYRIADYLDEKCAKIDAVIEKQKQVIEKLKEYKLSVITEAVTKGLDPTVPMKDSGVEWIGEIPAHWNCNLIKKCVSTTKGFAFKQEDFLEEGVQIVKVSDIKNGTIIKGKSYLNPNRVMEFRNVLLKENDIILTTVGSTPDVINSAVGQIAMVPRDYEGSLLNQNTVMIRCKNYISNKFLFYQMNHSSYRQYLNLVAHGTANQASISIKDILDYLIVVPPQSEQNMIVNYLDRKCSEIDSSIAKKQAIIEKLTEYKKSLIYEVVTGKREV